MLIHPGMSFVLYMNDSTYLEYKMMVKNLQTVCFLGLFAFPLVLLGNSEDPQLVAKSPSKTSKENAPNSVTSKTNEMGTENNTKETVSQSSLILPNKCEISAQFSLISYGELTSKLEKALDQKNKSSIFLELRTLQAQVDVLVSHLLSLDSSEKNETQALLEKTLAYLNQLESLLIKAKSTSRMIKEEHVIPLATMTSLKADYDSCIGSKSVYQNIFKTLSQLNIDLTEILMISRQRLIAQKNGVFNLIEKVENNKNISVQSISSHLNFIQNQINAITNTYSFDVTTLNIASAE